MQGTVIGTTTVLRIAESESFKGCKLRTFPLLLVLGHYLGTFVIATKKTTTIVVVLLHYYYC